jgi:hypothetical protein
MTRLHPVDQQSPQAFDCSSQVSGIIGPLRPNGALLADDPTRNVPQLGRHPLQDHPRRNLISVHGAVVQTTQSFIIHGKYLLFGRNWIPAARDRLAGGLSPLDERRRASRSKNP